jgi:hypothetical protein
MPFIQTLNQTRAEVRQRNADPWRLRLERARGKIGDYGIERVSSQTLLDLLEVPQRARSAGACRRLAKVMRELGWIPIRPVG